MLRRLAKVETMLGDHEGALKTWTRAWHRTSGNPTPQGAAEATIASSVVKMVLLRADVAKTSWARQIKPICAAIRAEAASDRSVQDVENQSLVECEEVMRFLGREQREKPPGQHWVNGVHGWVSVLLEWATLHSTADANARGGEDVRGIPSDRAHKLTIAALPDLHPLVKLLRAAIDHERDLLVRHGASRQVAFERSEALSSPLEISSLFAVPPPDGGRVHGENKAVASVTCNRRALRATAVRFANAVLQCEPPRMAYEGCGTVTPDQWPRESCTRPELEVDENEAENSSGPRRDAQWAERWGFQYPDANRHCDSCTEGLQEGESVEAWWDDLPEKHEPEVATEFFRRWNTQWE